MSRYAPARTAGFTLLEVLIAVVIVTILAAIAIPNYRGQVLRSNRSDAMAALLRVAAAQEKFYLQNNTYTNKLGDDGLKVGDRSANKHYELDITRADADGFLVKATPLGRQVDDLQCEYFSIDNLGTRIALNDDDADTTETCWR